MKPRNQGKSIIKEAQPENTKSVYTLVRSKSKGEVIETSDLVLVSKNEIFTKDALKDVKLAVGKRLKKSLKMGAILKAKDLKPDWLVHKDQKIIIENKVGGIYVAVEGIALENGGVGDRVKAKNTSSSKTVEGFVVSQKKISIFHKIY